MAIKNKKRGIALLITLIFMSVMLAFGLALASLAYKQSILASDAVQSQKAFYAADGALECALYADQRLGSYIGSPPDLVKAVDAAVYACKGTVYGTATTCWGTSACPGYLQISERIAFNTVNGAPASCADITIRRYTTPIPPAPASPRWKTFVFSTGYNVPCSQIGQASTGGRVVVRGIFERH